LDGKKGRRRKAMKISRRAWLGSAIVLAAASFVGAAEAAPQIGAAAPAFQATDATGAKRSLAEFAGKPVVLEWSNNQCPFVKKHYETGNMQALQRAAVTDGAVWLTIISSAPGKQGHVTGAKAQELTRARNAAPSAVLLDESGAIGKLYGARTTPHMFVIGADGKLVYQGAIDDKPAVNHNSVKGARNYVREALTATRAGRAPAVTSTQAYGCSVKYAS
jgi:peroxiredoxin